MCLYFSHLGTSTLTVEIPRHWNPCLARSSTENSQSASSDQIGPSSIFFSSIWWPISQCPRSASRLIFLHWSNHSAENPHWGTLAVVSDQKKRNAYCKTVLDSSKFRKQRRGDRRSNTPKVQKKEGMIHTHIGSSFPCSSLVRCWYLMMYTAHFETESQV